MRFALVGPVYPYRGGIAHYTTMLYRALRERGHDVLLISFKRQYPQWLFPGKSDKDPSKEPLEAEDAHYWIDSLNPITWLTTFWRIRRFRPDGVILQWWTGFWTPVWSILGALTRLVLRRPLTFICHNVFPHEARRWDRYLTRMAMYWGTRFIVQSSAERERFLASMPEAKLDVVPHPVYDMFVDKRVTQREARTQLNLPLDVPILLFFGFVRDYKGLADVIAALPEIRARLGEVRLVVAGEFWDEKRPYLEMIERLGIGDIIIIDDRYIPNEEVPLYFSAADVLVAPYRRVTGSGVIQIACGLGLPIIDDAIAGGDGHTAQRRDTVSVAEWCNAVVRLLEERRREFESVNKEAEAPTSFQEVARVLERALRSERPANKEPRR